MTDVPVNENPQYSQTMRQITTQDRGAPDTFNPLYQTLLDNDNYLKILSEQMKAVKLATIPAGGWSAEAPYVQTVSVEGIKAEDTPCISVFIPIGTTVEEEKAIKKASGCVSYIDTGEGSITVTCLGKKPVVDFQVQIKGI